MTNKPKTIETTITWFDPREKLPSHETRVLFLVHHMYAANCIVEGDFYPREPEEDDTGGGRINFFTSGMMRYSIDKNQCTHIKYWAYLPTFEDL